MNRLGCLSLLAVLLWSSPLSAAWDQLSFPGWSGTAYWERDWFTYQMKEPYSNDSMKFESGGPFVLSPQYAAPIRKIVLKVVSKSDAPTRFLQVCPLSGGVEVPGCAHTLSNDLSVTEIVKDSSCTFALDFSAGENITAFIVSLGSGNKGNWALEGLCVFFGEKSAGEDDKLLEYAQQLSTPDNLRFADFTTESLQLVVDPVTGADGYRFEAFRLTGVPLTIRKEDFISLPSLSDGWTFGQTNNVVLSQATGSNYPDTKTSSDGSVGLQIAKGNSAEDVRVEILSPLVEAAISECSYVSKRASNESSDSVVVYGRTSGDGSWTALIEPKLISTSKQWTTNAIPVESDIRQVKFVFTANAATCRNCGLDTLRIVFGGDEERESVGVNESTADSPTAEFTNLETARYAVRAQAVGGTTSRNSSWTEEKIVDLSWASVTVAAPESVVCEQSGSILTVSWLPVVGAETYRIELVSVDDPDSTAACQVTTTATFARLNLPSVGQYAVTVSAISPGGKSVATSASIACEAVLSPATEVKAEAIDRTTMCASWQQVPLAERYQVRLVRIGGQVSEYAYGWPTDGDRCGLPDGWESAQDWNGDKWTSGGTVYPCLPYTHCWLSSAAYEAPVTRLTCKYKCHSSSATTLDVTRFAVSVSSSAGEWEVVTNLTTTTSLQEVMLTFAAERDVRRIRLTADSISDRYSGMVDVGALTVTVGSKTRTEVSSVSTESETMTFRDLDPEGRYQVAVVPQPSDGDSLAAFTQMVDLSKEKFRASGAIPLSQLKGGVYLQDFTCLTNVTSDLEPRKLNLDYWQFFKGSGESEKVLYSSATNRTTGGVYVFSDADRTVDSFALGTLATSTLGCSVGVAFWNDLGSTVALRELAFDWIQRTARTGTNTNVVEFMVTDGATGIGAEGVWTTLSQLVPQKAGEFNAQANRMAIDVDESLPLAVPAGNVLILRWRHEKGAAGPMMAIDNVRLSFPDADKGFRVIVR